MIQLAWHTHPLYTYCVAARKRSQFDEYIFTVDMMRSQCDIIKGGAKTSNLLTHSVFNRVSV